MNKKTQLVYAGWLRLTEQEKQELLEEIKKYESKSHAGKILEGSTILKMDVGPISGGCPCCGR